MEKSSLKLRRMQVDVPMEAILHYRRIRVSLKDMFRDPLRVSEMLIVFQNYRRLMASGYVNIAAKKNTGEWVDMKLSDLEMDIPNPTATSKVEQEEGEDEQA